MFQETKKKYYSWHEALEKLKKYCAYQERTHQEVRAKSRQYNLNSEEAERAIVILIEENYLNELRFALAYASGKSKLKGWGPLKIKNRLQQKGISEYCIEQAMKQIKPDDLELLFDKWVEKKGRTLKSEKNQRVKKEKLARFLIAKGFDANMVMKKLNTER
jgi:regulatory protein